MAGIRKRWIIAGIVAGMVVVGVSSGGGTYLFLHSRYGPMRNADAEMYQMWGGLSRTIEIHDDSDGNGIYDSWSVGGGMPWNPHFPSFSLLEDDDHKKGIPERLSVMLLLRGWKPYGDAAEGEGIVIYALRDTDNDGVMDRQMIHLTSAGTVGANYCDYNMDGLLDLVDAPATGCVWALWDGQMRKLKYLEQEEKKEEEGDKSDWTDARFILDEPDAGYEVVFQDGQWRKK